MISVLSEPCQHQREAGSHSCLPVRVGGWEKSFTVSAAVRRHESQGDQFPVDFKSSSAQGCHHGSWYHCNIVSEGQTNANAECSQIHVYQSHSNCLSVCPLQAFLAGSTRGPYLLALQTSWRVTWINIQQTWK